MEKLVKRHVIVSVRTGQILKASPRRLRYTFATNKAEMLEPSVLAELLDHSDIRSVLVYYNARESISEELGRKLGKTEGQSGYRAVTDAFAGIPIKVVPRSEAEKFGGLSTRRFVPAEMIEADLREIPGIGNCAGNYKCGNAPIVSCYNCDEFMAWQDADHRAVVDWLRNEIRMLRSLPETAEVTLSDFELALVRAEQIVRLQEMRSDKEDCDDEEE